MIRDGVTLGPASIGVALPVDPGAHSIVVRNADGAEQEHHVELTRGEKKTIDIVPPAGKPLASAGPPDGATSASLRPWAFVALGAGVLGLGAGALTGGLALGKKDVIDAHCNGVACDAEGKQAADAAQTLGAISTVTFIAGGVLAAVSVVLFVLEPHRAKPSALLLMPASQGTMVVGRW